MLKQMVLILRKKRQPRQQTRINQKVLRAMKQLDAVFNPDASRVVEEFKAGRDLSHVAKYSTIAFNAHSEMEEPKIFQEA